MSRKITLVFLAMAFFSLSLFSQQVVQREALLMMAAEKSQLHAAEKKLAIRRADSLGIPVRQVLEGGIVIELQRFEQGVPIYYITHNREGGHTISTSPLYPGGSSGLALTGKGETLGMWDAGAVLASHREFQGRAIQKDDATSVSSHATHVAGTMIGAGVDPTAKGMAYEATLHAYDWNDDDAQMAQAAANGLRVSQHSYGAITGWHYNYRNDERWAWFGTTSVDEGEDYRFGFYNDRARDWDNIAYMAPHYLIVKSAGNDRGQGPSSQPVEHWENVNGNWVLSTTVRKKDGGTSGFDCISTNSTAKNIISVGAVHGLPNGYRFAFELQMSSFSSWGPTDDGRIKPDLVAKGVGVNSSSSPGNEAYKTQNGTSMAGPMVSGSIGLLLQHHRDLYGDNPMLSSTMKALLIHSADEAGHHQGPDYMFGWGLMNTARAAAIMSENADYGGMLHIQEHTLAQDQEVLVPVLARGDEPLRVTIVWTDVPGEPLPAVLNDHTPMLVNDLDLRLSAGQETEYKPYVLDPAAPSKAATTGDNHRDNVEMVLVKEPVAGQTYMVRISHKNNLRNGKQTFSLVVTGNSDGHNPVAFTAEPLNDSAIKLSWIPNAADDQVMIVASTQNVFGVPKDGSAFVPGDTLAGGGTVVYSGGDKEFEHQGLQPGIRYYYKAFSIDSEKKYSLGRIAQAMTFCSLISELPYNESFDTEGELPTCWEVVDSLRNLQVWKIGTIAFGLPEGQGNYALIDSKGYSKGGRQHASLVSPAFDFSGYTMVRLSFRHYFRQYMESSAGVLSFSADYGQTWHPLRQWTRDTSNPEDFTIELPELAGLSPVTFRWEYTGGNSHYWLVDDVQVTGEKGLYARMGADAQNVFVGHPVTFSDLSGGGEISSRSWDFGAGALASGTSGEGPHEVFYQEPGLKTISLTINDSITIVKEHFIQVHSINFEAPSLIKAAVAYQDVSLQWTMPGPSLWMNWDSGINASGLGTGGAAVFQVAQRFTPEDLMRQGAASRYLTQVAMVPRVKDAIYTIKVWVGGNWEERNPGMLVAAQQVDQVVENQWNVISLNHPVFADPSRELWIGYHVNTPEGHPIGMDQGKALEGMGNLFFWNGGWTTLSAYNIDRNINIHGFFEASPSGQQQENSNLPVVDGQSGQFFSEGLITERSNADKNLALASHLGNETLTPVLTGYSLYRNGESQATFDNPFHVLQVDSALADGTYQYQVVAHYTAPAGDSAPSSIIEVTVDGSVPQYTLTLANDPVQGGIAENLTTKESYQAGEQVQLKAVAFDGYVFKEWITAEGPVSDLPEFTFEMPANNVLLTALFQSTVSTGEVEAQDLRVYPNPSRGVFNIQSESPIRKITVYDLSGKIIQQQDMDRTAFTLSCTNWKPGVYYLQVVTAKGVQVRKLMLMDQ